MNHRTRLAHLAVLLIAVASGCQNLASIPLFNPDASLKNKIASAYEVYGEMNGQVAEFVAKGWLTQDEVNRSWSPSLDAARKSIDAADVLRKSGDPTGSQQTLDSVKSTLQAIRDQLAHIRKSRS
jgi:hypothetical protein